ncbi:hypothetical protein MIT1002_03967 [Alteromonas macleodii]|nr:hypothetical protein MIT1002_03967 [Alteromonas macleodii]VTP56440.1 hypothetical protein MIT1002_03967 [Alteromonas macleodii]
MAASSLESAGLLLDLAGSFWNFLYMQVRQA